MTDTTIDMVPLDLEGEILPEVGAVSCRAIATRRVLAVYGVDATDAACVAAARTTASGTRPLDGYHAIGRLTRAVEAVAAHVPADLVHRLAPPFIRRILIDGVGHADAVTARRGDLVEVSGRWCSARDLDAAPTRCPMRAPWLRVVARHWPLLEALAELRVDGVALVADALADATGRRVAALDAAIRHLAALRRAGAIARGEVAPELVRLLADDEQIPMPCWRARPIDDDTAGALADLAAMPADRRAAVLDAMAEQSGDVGAEAVEVPPVDHLPVGGSWGSGWVVADLSPVTLVRRRGDAKGS